MGAMGDSTSDGVQGEVVVVSVTTPDEDVAARLCRHLVEQRLAACAQIGGPIRSTYRWKGEVEVDPEWMVTIKTSSARLDELVEAVNSLHPAQVPEVVATPAVGGDPAYLRWVLEETA